MLMVNDCVFIQNGKIAGNPFYFRLDNSEAVHWILSNEDVVRKKIKFWFSELGLLNNGGNVDDCLSFAVKDFIENRSKVFKKNFFGKDSTYSVENYCLTLIKYCVQNYAKDLKDKLANQISLGTTNEAESSKSVVVEETLANYNQTAVDEYIVNTDFTEYDEKFSWLYDYQKYFLDKKYKKFNIMNYLVYMYFDINKVEDDTVNFIDGQIKYVAKKLGEPESLIKLVTNDFRKDVENGNVMALDVYEIIGELVDATKFGWKPKLLLDLEEEEYQESLKNR